MKTNEIQQKEIKKTMEIDGSLMSVLNETRKWTKLLSILGFMGVGLILLSGLLTGTIFNSVAGSKMTGGMTIPTTTISIIYIAIAIVYFFPVLYLLNFSNKMKKALYSSDHEALYEAFKYLKNHYKFIGIIMIVSLLIGGAFIIGIGIFTALSV